MDIAAPFAKLFLSFLFFGVCTLLMEKKLGGDSMQTSYAYHTLLMARVHASHPTPHTRMLEHGAHLANGSLGSQATPVAWLPSGSAISTSHLLSYRPPTATAAQVEQ